MNKRRDILRNFWCNNGQVRRILKGTSSKLIRALFQVEKHDVAHIKSFKTYPFRSVKERV